MDSFFFFEQITVNPLMVWPVLTLPSRGSKLNTSSSMNILLNILEPINQIKIQIQKTFANYTYIHD